MNTYFLNRKIQKKEMSFLEGEDNVINNLKEVCSKVNIFEKMIMDDDGIIDNIIKIDKKFDESLKYGNDSWVALKARVDRLESSLSGSIETKKNSEIGLVENVKEEEEEEEDKEEVKEDEVEEEEEEKEDVLNVTPNPEDDIKVDN